MGHSYERGRLLYRQARYAMAIEEFQKELAQFPNSTNAMSMLALSLTYAGRYDDAVREAKAAVAADPEAAFSHYALAAATIGKTPERLRVRAPYLGQLFNGLMQYRRRLKRARAPAMEAVRLNPMNADFYAMLAGIDLDLQYPRRAQKWADKGLSVRADHVRCANLRAKALARQGKVKAARQTLESALAVDPENASIHASSGWTLLQAGDHAQAAEHFRESLRLDPTDPHTQQGLHQARRGRLYRAPAVAIFLLIGVLVGAVQNPPRADFKMAAAIAIPVLLAVFIGWMAWDRHKRS